MFTLCLKAQYYGWGRSAPSIKWNSVKAVSGRIIYPDYYESGAARVSSYLDAIRKDITYGYKHGPIKLPTILHTQNFQANGLVLWAPKRMEFEAIPLIDTYAEPWLKQLSTHEYRHAVQYGNLYRGLMRPLGWLIGQQSGLISSALVPLWFIEGDATMAETQMSSFGRALQPSFTLEYRAYFTEDHKKYPVDRWFCGSYRTFIPDHYKFGYQLTAWSREKYGDDMWNSVMRYSARYPFTILTSKWALKKYYKTSATKIARNTIADLKEFWLSQPKVENTSSIIPTEITSYTTYSDPMQFNDTVIIALKKDMDRASRFVAVDASSGDETKLFYTGNISSRPVLKDGVVYWTEFRNSVFWEQRVNTKVCYYDLRTRSREVLRSRGNALYPTPVSDGELYTVGYDYKGIYSIENNAGTLVTFPDTVSVHGLCYDEETSTLVYIGLCDAGMYIGRIGMDDLKSHFVTMPSRVTVRNIRAGDGKLTFSSIASGKDEVHIYDLYKNEEYRLSESTYGSASPAEATGRGELYFTTYTIDGYRLAKQKIVTDSMDRIHYSELPANTINPPRRKWNVVNIDTVSTVTKFSEKTKVRRYRKAVNLFNIHSWAPWSFNPSHIVNEDRIDFGFGATVMSQNLMSNTSAYLSYGYTGKYGSRVYGNLSYYGLAPKFDIDFEYGGGKQLIYGMGENSILPSKLANHFHVTAKVSLPMVLSSGYRYKVLTPSVEMMHLNALLYSPDGQSYDKGYERMVSTLQYIDNLKMATRDILPRWGFAFKASSVMAPFKEGFSHLWSVFGRAYTPGVALHHSITLRANYQHQRQARYNFMYKELYPRGASYDIAFTNYVATSVDYQLPVWYPDFGINSIVYFNRVRLRGYYDFARARTLNYMNESALGRLQNITSYGGEITFDMNIIRIPNRNASIGVYVYKPNDRSGVVTGINIELPL